MKFARTRPIDTTAWISYGGDDGAELDLARCCASSKLIVRKRHCSKAALFVSSTVRKQQCTRAIAGDTARSSCRCRDERAETRLRRRHCCGIHDSLGLARERPVDRAPCRGVDWRSGTPHTTVRLRWGSDTRCSDGCDVPTTPRGGIAGACLHDNSRRSRSGDRLGSARDPWPTRCRGCACEIDWSDRVAACPCGSPHNRRAPHGKMRTVCVPYDHYACRLARAVDSTSGRGTPAGRFDGTDRTIADLGGRTNNVEALSGRRSPRGCRDAAQSLGCGTAAAWCDDIGRTTHRSDDTRHSDPAPPGRLLEGPARDARPKLDRGCGAWRWCGRYRTALARDKTCSSRAGLRLRPHARPHRVPWTTWVRATVATSVCGMYRTAVADGKMRSWVDGPAAALRETDRRGTPPNRDHATEATAWCDTFCTSLPCDKTRSWSGRLVARPRASLTRESLSTRRRGSAVCSSGGTCCNCPRCGNTRRCRLRRPPYGR